MHYVFIDTEFTDFTNMDLISLGAVTESGGHEFYVEITNHVSSYRTDFVKQVVIPLLDMDKYGKSRQWAAYGLAEWLNGLDGNEVTIVVDYSGDWELMDHLLKESLLPVKKKIYVKMWTHALVHMLHSRGIHMDVAVNKALAASVAGTVDYFKEDPRQHHALVDAKANRAGWIAAYEAGK